VAVIGGGITGLAAAWELSEATGSGTRVIVFEGGPRFGGKIETETFGGREVDLGPDAFVARRPEALALCTELGLGPDLVAPGVRRAYVWARARLRPLPTGLALGVPTRLGPLIRSGICSPPGLARPALDLLRPALGRGQGTGRDSDETVGELVRRRLGREVTARLAAPLIGGIHAGDVDTMSAAAVFPALLEADGRPGSLMRALRAATPAPDPSAPVFLTVRGGLGRLVDELTRALERRGVELRAATPVAELGRVAGAQGGRWVVHTAGSDQEADGLVVAVPATPAAGLLRAHDPALAEALLGVTYATVSIITMRFADDVIGHRLDGSGFLVPAGNGQAGGPLVTACTWLTSKWPELRRPGDVLLRVSVGRQGDDRAASLDDGELVARCLAELGPMLGLHGGPLDTLVTRWPDAFPQYPVGHLTTVRAMEAAAARLPSLALAGAAFHGVGIPACIGSGRRAARAVAAAVAPVTGVAR
jgi:oxygen-dependent protoporphyrinogen oxidase